MLPKYHQQFHHQQLFSSANPGTIQACTSGPATATLESSLSAAAVAAAAVNYAHQHNSPSPTGSSPQHSGSSASTSPAARTSSMYPYVSAAAAHHHHQQQQAVAAAAFGATSSMVPGFGSTAASSAALAAAAAVDAATAGDKSCRYTASLTGNVAPTSADPMVNYTLGHHHQNGATPGSLVSSASASSAVSAASASMAAAAQFYHQAAAASAVVDPLTSCQQPTTGQPGISDIPRYPWMSITGECSLCMSSLYPGPEGPVSLALAIPRICSYVASGACCISMGQAYTLYKVRFLPAELGKVYLLYFLLLSHRLHLLLSAKRTMHSVLLATAIIIL